MNKVNPGINFLVEKLRELEQSYLFEKRLRQYGRKVHGGYMMTVGDMAKALNIKTKGVKK